MNLEQWPRAMSAHFCAQHKRNGRAMSPIGRCQSASQRLSTLRYLATLCMNMPLLVRRMAHSSRHILCSATQILVSLMSFVHLPAHTSLGISKCLEISDIWHRNMPKHDLHIMSCIMSAACQISHWGSARACSRLTWHFSMPLNL